MLFYAALHMLESAFDAEGRHNMTHSERELYIAVITAALGLPIRGFSTNPRRRGISRAAALRFPPRALIGNFGGRISERFGGTLERFLEDCAHRCGPPVRRVYLAASTSTICAMCGVAPGAAVS